MSPKIPSTPAPAPAPPAPIAVPVAADIDQAAEAEAKRQKEALQRRRLASNSILTGGAGLGSPAPTTTKNILGG